MMGSRSSNKRLYHLVPETHMEMMARPLKRPLDQLAMGCLSEYPTNFDTVSNPVYVDCDNLASISTVPNSSLYGLPGVSIDNFNAGFQSSGFAVDPLVAHDTTVPSMSFSSDLTTDVLSLSNYYPSLGPMTSQFVYLQDNFQSQAPLVPSQGATMNSSFEARRNQRHKSSSNTSMEVPSIQGRSVGSEYVIDSPYDCGQGGVMTPGTAQSFEFVERFPEADPRSDGMLPHENDLIGLEINQSLQTVPFEMQTTREYSRSPQGISLDGIYPGSAVSTFAYNGYNNRLPNANSDPWVPFSSAGSLTTNLGDVWNGPYNFFPTPNPGFPIQQDHSPMRKHSNVNLDHMGEASYSTEPGHNSAHRKQSTSLEPTNPPSSSDHPTNNRRKAGGRRKGPLNETTKGGAKSTREVHACWCCRMRKVTCNSDKTGNCPECERFWRHKMTGQFSNKCICIRTPLEDLEQIFFPDFMVEHFKSTSMDSFINDLVGKNGWMDRGKTDVQLLCGFGPPLIVKNVQEFRPNGVVQIFQWRRDNPGSIEAVQTLPLGISQANFWAEGKVLDDLEQHLDQIINEPGDLDEFADRVLRSHGYNRSSRTLKAVLQWYQDWRGQESMSKKAETLLRNAIKVIMITTIFGRRLILQDIPQQFDKFFYEAPYTSRNYSRHRQCPRLINRQVKAALRVLQQKLLSKVLKDFGRELTEADGWPVFFAVAVILAFSLEHIQERSIGYYRKNKACEGRDRDSVQCLGSEEAIREYRTVALVRVFDIIHVLVRCKSEKQVLSDGRRTKKVNSIASSLRKLMNDLKEKFDAEEQIHLAQLRLKVGEEPCRLVSALLELIQ